MELVAYQGLSRYSAPYWWRLIATALSFSLFGIGGVLLRVVVFPLLALLPGDALVRRTRARGVVSRTFSVRLPFPLPVPSPSAPTATIAPRRNG